MSNPIEWIRARSTEFRAVGSQIQRLQHRAALAKIAARTAGNTVMVSDMAATIARLGSLRNLHAGAVARLDGLNAVLAKLPGVDDNYLGALPVIPIAIIALATALVAIMVVVFHKSSVESQRLDLAEKVLGAGSGTPDASQLAKLKALADLANSGGSKTDAVSGIVGSLLQPLAIGVALVVVGPKLLDMVGKRTA